MRVNDVVKDSVKIIQQVDHLLQKIIILFPGFTWSGEHLLANVVNETTSEKKIVAWSNVSGSTDSPNFSLSATCRGNIRYNKMSLKHMIF